MPTPGAMVELQLGSTWTDVTSDVYLRDRIKITRGRQDQGARVDPGSCTLTLNNKGGKYSPRNPLSPLYGQIGRNTPLRVSVQAGSTYLDHTPTGTDHRVSTPSTAALQITGDLDVRLDIEPSDWDASAGALVDLGGKWGPVGQRAWHVYAFAGTVRFGWTTDGTTELTALAPVSTTAHTPRMCVRITVDVNNGAGGRDVSFYAGPSMAGPWTQIGTTQTFAGTTPTASSTAPLEIGDVSGSGFGHIPARIYAAQVRSGIGGTVVANPDFTTQAPGTITFTDSAGVPWTASSSTVLTNRQTRFVGEISAWPSRWDVSGGDVYVPVQAAGIMRRLGQGSAPLASTLRRRITSFPSVVAYWPFEDGQTATQAYSPIEGVPPARVRGAQMAADDSLAGSSALPVWPQGSAFTCTVPPYPASTSWQVQHVYRIDTMPVSYSNLLVIQGTGTVRRWEIAHQVGAIRIRGYDSNSGLVVDQAAGVGSNLIGAWVRQVFSLTQSGSNVLWHAAWVVVGAPGGAADGSYSGTMGQVSDVHQTYVAAFDNLRLGHVGVFSDATAGAFNGADTGFNNDSVGSRLARLTAEEGVPLLTPHGPAGTAAMGPQRPNALLDLLEEATDADVGILYEAREAISLAARGSTTLYNQAPVLALDYNRRGDVAPPLEPIEDDDATRNDVTISRPDGSSARATLDAGSLSTLPPPLGVGRYATSSTVNVAADSQLADLAGWLLHLGTVDEPRYPTVTVNLAAGPWLVMQAMTVDIGDLITIANPPPWLPPGTISLMCQGYTETIGWADWTIAYNCTPGSPWRVGVFGDPVLGRADTAGAQLAAGASTTATSLSVATTSGPLWVTTATNPAEFPFDIRVGGEVMTVTGITGTASPQAFTVTRAVNGIRKTQLSAADVRLAQPMIFSL